MNHATKRLLSALTLTTASLALAAGCGAADAGGGAYASAYDASSWGGAGGDAGGGAWWDSAGASDIAPGSDPGPGLPPPPPPEDEQDFDLRSPEAGATRLYIPSAALDALVVVDALDLGVDLVEVGSRPIGVRALPGDTGAIVLNAGSSDVTIVRPAQGAAPFTTVTLDVPPHHNRLALSPDGTWAFAWYTPSGDPLEPVGAMQDVSAIRTVPGQEVVYNLSVGLRPEAAFFTEDSATALFLCEDGISGVTLALLDRDTFLPPVPIHDDLFIKPTDREVVVTPDARYAIVRDLDRPELTLVDIDANVRRVLALPDWPSDLDMTPDGAKVVVPFKGRQEVAILGVPDAWLFEAPPMPQPDPDPEPVPEAAPDAGSTDDLGEADAGSADAAGFDAAGDALDDAAGADLGFTGAEGDTTDDTAGSDVAAEDATADPGPAPAPPPPLPPAPPAPPQPFAGPADGSPITLEWVLWALEQNPHATLSFTGHPFGVTELTADGRSALLYTTQAGTLAVAHLDVETGEVGTRPLAKEVLSAAIAPDGATAVLINRKSSGRGAPEAGSNAYTLINLATGYAKLVLTANEPTELVFSDDGAELYVLLPDPWGLSHQVHRIEDFAVTTYPTPDAPVYVGLMPAAGKAAVMLDDPTGWLTFIDAATGKVDQVNSFELNSFIQ